MTIGLTGAAPASSGAGPGVARAIIIAALTFNLVLSIANANILRVTAAPVIAVELLLIGIAAVMIATRSATFLVISFVLAAYLSFEMAMRYDFDAKAYRDAFIPIVFYFLGRHYGSPEAGDRLVTAAIVIVAIGALVEWLFLEQYLKYVNVLGYYIARGTVATDPIDGPGLFISGTRFDGRTMFSFLGTHRVSSVFLEPVSLGNFGPIVFGWVLLRDRARPVAMIVKMLLILAVLILGDSRFGIMLCAVVVMSYFIAPLVRPGMLFVAPFLIVIALLAYAWNRVGMPWDNTTVGRFLFSGQLLSTLDLAQAFGVKTSTVNFDDSGYSYMLSRFGVIGTAALWALYVFGSPASTLQSWRFKMLVCLYLILLLSISTSSVTIKTAALFWFLAGSIAIGTTPAPRSFSQPENAGSAQTAAQG